MINEAGLAHRFEREPGGEVVAEIAFDELTKRYERDAAGRITRMVRPGVGRATAIEYDAMGRALAVTHASGDFERYGYDALGRLLRAENQHATVELSRDALGRVIAESTTVDGVTQTIESKLDHAGRRVGLRSSLGAEVTIGRSALGDVLKVSQHGEGFADWEVAFTRDVFGQEIDRQLPGGARTYWWRDKLGRPTQHWIGREDASMRARKYTWAAGDRLVSIADEGHGGCEYGYDARGALVQTEHADGRIELRATDDVGNLFETLAGADRQYGLAGELLKRTGSDGVTTYRYDAEGNLAERRDPDGGVWLYHWDDAGTLAQVDRPDASAVAMQYDALGRRIAKSHRGRRTRWLWDGEVKLHEWQESAEAPEVRLTPEESSRVRFLESSRELFPQLYGDGWEQRWDVLLADDGEAPRSHAVVRARLNPAEPPVIDPTVITWLHEPDTFTPLARITKESAHAIVADHLGTPLAVLEDAELRAQLVTDTNGRATITGDRALCPFRFPGHYFDEETELHENRFRHYDPATGRYLSRDPLGLRGGLGAYAYVRNPTTWTDPLGLAAKPAAGAGCDSAPGEHRYGTKKDGTPRAKPGPKTDANSPHNATIRAEADRLEAEGHTILRGGGRGPEAFIPTPGGRKTGRRPDILFETPSGELRGRNVGRSRRDASPIKRERDALDDLNGAGLPADFVPYD